jgi:hypothetical protein
MIKSKDAMNGTYSMHWDMRNVHAILVENLEGYHGRIILKRLVRLGSKRHGVGFELRDFGNIVMNCRVW